MLDTVRVAVPDAEDAEWTSVAFGDSVGLVVWESESRLKGCRVDARSKLLDSCAIDVGGPSYGCDGRPSVASAAARFLVVWKAHSELLMAAVVDFGGNVTRRVELLNSPSVGGTPSVGVCGNLFVVVFNRTDGRAVFVRIQSDGTVIDSVPRWCVPRGGIQLSPAIGSGDSACVATWDGFLLADTGVFCNVIRPDGSVGSPTGSLVGRGNQAAHPQACFNGQHFVVMWHEAEDDSELVKVARVDRLGTVIDTFGFQVAADGFQHTEWTLGLASVEDTTLLVWSSLRDSTWAIRGLRLDRDMLVLDSAPFDISTRWAGSPFYAPQGPSVSAVGYGFLVVWTHCMGQELLNSNSSVVARRVSADGHLPDSTQIIISYAANSQFEADVATDGTNFLAAWVEYRPELTAFDRVIYARAFRPDGQPLGQANARIAAPGCKRPSVAFGGGYYLITWEGLDPLTGLRDIMAARVEPEGRLVDTCPIAVARGQDGTRGTDAAYADSVFLVVWHSAPTRPARVNGARVLPSGQLIDSVPLVLQRRWDRDQGNPQVASDGDVFLVTRSEFVLGHVLVLRVSTAGTILDSTELDLGVDDYMIDVVVGTDFGAGVFLAAELSIADGTAWRISPSGMVLDSGLDTDQLGRNPAVVFDGEVFLLLGRHSIPDQIRATRVTRDGEVLDPQPMVLTRLDTEECRIRGGLRPVVGAVTGLGEAAVVFCPMEYHGYLSRRVRVVTFPRLAVGEERSSDQVLIRLVVPSPLRAGAPARVWLELGTASPVEIELLDAAGRRVMELRPGANDVRHLTPGVYFVREQLQASGLKPQAIRKIIIAR
jgi:hypothetical protein